jgi:hypothetical protein
MGIARGRIGRGHSGRVLPALLASLFLVLLGCANGQPTGGGANTFGASAGDTDGDSSGDGSGICLLHNCSSDGECDACTEGRNTCYTPDRRCVACDPDSGAGCPDGQVCTDFGNCVPVGQTCDTDEDGTPTITCNDDPDCAACDPNHQVCAAGRCVQCRGDNTAACTGAEQCIDNECAPRCPASCTTDADCSSCGEEGYEAHACHNHKCAQCSSSVPCSGGEYCTDQGVCAGICGIPGQTIGTCENDSHCAGCQGDNNKCILPINGDRGKCGPSASGCSDLGNGVVVLPSPFDQVTNACSNPSDCDGVGIQYNVGKLLRDITGISSIDDAIIEYPMNECAAVTVAVGDNSVSCGICVPCKVDSDCMDIELDEVAGDAFGPLGAIATALLLDTLFGSNSHTIHMFCQPIVAGYGACVPCPTLINNCKTGGPVTGSGNCSHPVNQTGDALDPSCSACANTVCGIDSYCCTEEWDSICVNLASNNCASGSCHDQCEEGSALAPSCNSCVAAICAEDPFCCETAWDDLCVGWVDTLCGGQCQGTACAHSPCSVGGPLVSGCSTCVTQVCNADPFCCETDWDSFCTAAAQDIPGCGC